MAWKLRSVLSGAAVALSVVFAVMAFAQAPVVDAGGGPVKHYLGSGLVRVAASGERLDFMVVNDEFQTRPVTLEILDSSNVVRASKQVNLDVGKTISISYDPGAASNLRALALLYRDADEVEIQCNDFPISLQVITTASPAKTRLYIGDFTHWHK